MIVDASVALKLLVEEPDSDLARRALLSADKLLAPDWVRMEVAHALWKKVKSEQLQPDHMMAASEALPHLLDDLLHSTPLLPRALTLSLQLGHSPYDCLYLATALQADDSVITADLKFVSAARVAGFSRRVRLLSEGVN